MKCKGLILSTLAGMHLAACSSQPTSETKNRSDIGVVQPELGDGHSDFTDEFVGSCLDMNDLTEADFEVILPKQGQVKFEYNLSADTVRDILNGDGKAKLDMKGFTASGDLKIENELKTDSLSSALSIIYHAGNGKHAIKNSGLDKLKLGRKIRAEEGRPFSNKEKAERCGTHFLSGYELSSSFVATLKFEFASESDKNRFDGHLKVELSKLEIEGGVDSTTHDIMEKAHVSMTITQRGGDVTKMGKTLNEHITKCNAQNKKSCLDAFEGLRLYVTNEFPKQFVFQGQEAAGEKVNPRSYWFSQPAYENYERVDPYFNGLKPTKEDRIALENVRLSLNDAFMIELRDKHRVRNLLQSGMVTSLLTRNKMRQAQETFDKRMIAIADAIAPCYLITEDIRPCKAAVLKVEDLEKQIPTYKERLAEYPVDYSLLSVQPTNFMEYCAQMKMWHTTYHGSGIAGAPGAVAANKAAAEIDMDHEVRETVTAMLNIPDIRSMQENREFDPYLTKEIDGKWSPAAEGGMNKNDQPFWNCSALRDKIHDVEEEVNFSNLRLNNIEPIVSFSNAFSIDVSNNRIRYGMSAVGKIEDLISFKAENSLIKILKGIRNDNVERLELRGNKFPSDQLEYISGSQALTYLDISENKLLMNLDSLNRLPSLEDLVVRNAKIPAAAMTSWFTGGGYDALGSRPIVYWDGEECPSVRAAIGNHASQLECD